MKKTTKKTDKKKAKPTNRTVAIVQITRRRKIIEKYRISIPKDIKKITDIAKGSGKTNAKR